MSRSLNTKHSEIFEYWKDKAILSDGTIIPDNFDDNTSVPVVYDYGEPSCWACGERYIEEVLKNKDYDEMALHNPKALYDTPQAKRNYNRCHIIPRQAGGSDEPSNLFLLCRKCHEESPDTLNQKNFFKWVYKKRKYEYSPFGIDFKRFFNEYLKDCKEKGKDPLTFNIQNAKLNAFTHGSIVSESTLMMTLSDSCEDIRR